MSHNDPELTDAAVEAFTTRWKNSGAAERSNSQSFLKEFCALLTLPQPDPKVPNDSLNQYVFEKTVSRHRPDGTVTKGDIDLYRRGCFVIESKQGVEAAAGIAPAKLGYGKRGTAAWDLALERAYVQACGYVKDLPASDGRPPFVIVCDIGHCFELYSEFTCTGGTYVRFPDPHRHRITLDDLRLEPVRDRFRRLWLDPLSLDPARRSARVTREIATLLARLANSLETAGNDGQVVASFLQRCLFSLFAEDTGLLPEKAFTHLIERCQRHPQGQVRFFEQMWAEMDRGTEFSTLLEDRIRRFNGEFFKSHTALSLTKDQLALLAEAGKADWTTVEPAIFGTLLERALDPATRHRLGAHYTPRAYVERLVFPTIVQPLREEWAAVKAAAAVSSIAADELRTRIDSAPPNADGRLRWIADEKKLRRTAAEPLMAFQKRLADIRVLDPACGSGNFLYVAFEHLKRLEGEVLELEEAILSDRAQLDMDVTRVHPSHFLGIELNPRAAALAELVLWIGYLQWQHRSGKFLPDDPVLSATRSVQHADAVLAYDGIKFLTDESGHNVRRWDGRTYKKHPVTGEDVPDESATVPIAVLINPRPAPPWPEADYIVGNPPFLGKGEKMRDALGDGYVESLRKCWPAVPDSADFVMYWWHRAASLVCQGKVKRFGLITTNSIAQTFNRRVVEAHLNGGKEERGAVGSTAPNAGEPPAPLSLLFVIPDHPWVDSVDGAAVRIAMTVGAAGIADSRSNGLLATVVAEHEGIEESEGVEVTIREKFGHIHADLTIGADVVGALPLKSNEGVTSMGMMIRGAGFILDASTATKLSEPHPIGHHPLIHRFRSTKDLTQANRGAYIIDLTGFESPNEVLKQFPNIYQHVLLHVKPERDSANDTQFRERWWLFGRTRPPFRQAIKELSRYVATGETAKHRFFVFLERDIIPDHTMIACFTDDAFHLGVLSSQIHVQWALAAGGTLEDRPRYNKTKCFDTFPFPVLAPGSELAVRIRSLGEQLDGHRKARQAAHPGLTLTGMYNVLTKLRGGDPLTAKEKVIHEQGLVSVLRQIHDDLDRTVLEAYGWSDIEIGYAPGEHIGMAYHDCLQPGEPSPEGPGELWNSTREAILTRLAALNRERAAEEAAGHIRWLRPDFQAPNRGVGFQPTSPTEIDLPLTESASATPSAISTKLPWPADLPAQATALRHALAAFPHGATPAQLASRFSKAPKASVTTLLETLAALGQARQDGDQFLSA